MTPSPLSPQQLDELLERAKDEVVRLCQGGQWRMTVPVNEDRDSDTLLMRALDEAQATVRRQQAVIDAVRGEIEQAKDDWALAAAEDIDAGRTP